MFEKWAQSLASKLKEVNPTETAAHDVLVFGFTILLNLLFTFLLVLTIGWLLGIPFLVVQISISFMILRILTGGAHVDHATVCSVLSMSLIILIALIFTFLPSIIFANYMYTFITLFIIWRYAPYYEAHQVVHSQAWERKKKHVSILWVFTTLLVYHFLEQEGFILGALLQALLLTPAGIKLTHKLNIIPSKGGELGEENS